jgi:hypothetical protein
LKQRRASSIFGKLGIGNGKKKGSTSPKDENENEKDKDKDKGKGKGRDTDTIVQLGARLARSSTFGSLSRRFGIAGRVAAR